MVLAHTVHLTALLHSLKLSLEDNDPLNIGADAGYYMRWAMKTLDKCTVNGDPFEYRMLVMDLARLRAVFGLSRDYFPSESGATGLRAWQVKP